MLRHPVEGNRPTSRPGSPFGAAENEAPGERICSLINNLGPFIPWEAYCAAEPTIEGEEANCIHQGRQGPQGRATGFAAHIQHPEIST
jgi:hypothetical protein